MENKIYIVRPTGSVEIEEIMAVFDSRKKADDFIDRFKTRPTDLEVMEFPLNPEYIVNKQADPYLVTLRENTNDPINLDVSDLIEQAEAAAREDYVIFFYNGAKRSEGVFEMLLFAESKEEGLSRAIKKKEETIASGEWDKEYQERLKAKKQ